MGHGDEIVIADANFPQKTMGSAWCARFGIGAVALLEAILLVSAGPV